MTDKYTILCVDDEKYNVDTLRRTLWEDYEVITALSGQEGLELLQQNDISLIITDQRMPQMTGVEFLEKSLDISPDIIRIILTGFTDIEDLIGAINTGRVYRYITKPWEPSDLRATVKRALESLELTCENKRLIAELEDRVAKRTAQLELANHNLQEANAQLIQLDQMKTQFVSQASHDLRTPLTAIKGSLDNLLMGIAGALNEKQQKVITRATKSVDRLTKLINDVLDLNRIETGRIVLEKSDIPFKTLVENIINENHPASEIKQIMLNADLGEERNLHIDGSKIERVVGELISNAIKYTSDGGTVNVRLFCENDMVSLSVKDSGIGMTAEECSKIWERFYRTSASKKFAKGSGLGLSIAKELVELHGGTIGLISQQGEGTTFTLTLPLHQE